MRPSGRSNLYYVLQIVHRDVTGMRLDYQFPMMTVLALVPVMFWCRARRGALAGRVGRPGITRGGARI